jgi:hypothetical protein
MGPPKDLSGLEIVDMLDKLMLDLNNLGISKVTKSCTIGLIYVDYGSYPTSRH